MILEAELAVPTPKWLQYDASLEQEFEIYWNTHGENIVLEKWTEKYGHLMENDCNSDLNTNDNDQSVGTWNPEEAKHSCLDITPTSNAQWSEKDNVPDEKSPSGSTTGEIVYGNKNDKLPNVENVGSWGDASSFASQVTNSHKWGEVPNTAVGNWGDTANTVCKESIQTNTIGKSPNTSSAGKEKSPLSEVANETSDQELWNVLWQEMYKTTRCTHYTEFMSKNSKSKSNSRPQTDKAKNNTISLEQNSTDKNANDSNTELPPTQTTDMKLSMESSCSKETTAFNYQERFNQRKNSGVGVFKELLKESSERNNLKINEENDDESPIERPAHVSRHENESPSAMEEYDEDCYEGKYFNSNERYFVVTP